jgi:adenylate cyclase
MISNQIADLPDCFPENCTLTTFCGDSNLFQTLPPSLLRLRRLETLSCTSCRLSTLPDFNLPQLRNLNLQFNFLQSLPDSFAASTFLSTVNFSFNKLTDLPPSLSTNRKVAFFFGSGNEFTKVPRPILKFSQLKTLVLSHNKITRLPKALQHFFFLQTVDFSNNNLQEYPSHINTLRSLKILSFSHNAISTMTGAGSFPPALTVFDVSFNSIEEITLDLRQTPCICLDYNPLRKIDPTIFKGTHFLSLNGCPLETPVLDLLPEFLEATDVHFIETLQSEPPAIATPPLRIHVLDSSKCSFPERFGVGYSATLGRRATMEDCVVLRTYSDSAFLFGVFDGHGGSTASTTAAHCLEEEVRLRIIESVVPNVAQAFAGCFTAVNRKLALLDVPDGCTAAVAFVYEDIVYAAGVGDSRIVRVRQSKCKRLTVDAKPTVRPEYQRLREAGLVINAEGRVGGKLGVARALGDFSCGDGIFVEPDVKAFHIKESDDAVVVACDGLWDMVSDEDAAEIVRKGETAADAAVALKNVAFALGSLDNITVIVVKWHPAEGDGGFCRRNPVERIPVEEEHEKEEEDAPQVVVFVPHGGDSHRDTGKKC